MEAAVDEVVRRQKEAGVDIASDGETSKISYATYVKDRYTGFAGDSPRNAPADLKLFPTLPRTAGEIGRHAEIRAPDVRGRGEVQGQGELGKDIANLRPRCKTWA
jgi:5-methyltetrahydropteroyltriglutamate--homocysteine methyltransferase